MHSKREAVLTGARLRRPFGLGDQASAAKAGPNCIGAMPEVSSTFGWYRPQRLLSPSEAHQS
jgi:hypothetical protein